MKKLVLMFSVLFSVGAFASQDFTCWHREKDGHYAPSNFRINLMDTEQVLVLHHREVEGLYWINSSKARMWITLNSNERRNVTLLVQSKMFVGRSGYIKQIQHIMNGPDLTDIYFCKPGRR